MKTVGIYIHIPFCIKKCFYCDFNSYALTNNLQIKHYFNALKQDIALSSISACGLIVKSIYLGGGTPSIINGEDIYNILNDIQWNFHLNNRSEITIEINPATLTRSKLNWYKKAGINRVSLGVQSFNDRILKFLGRAHNSNDIIRTLSLLKERKFNNISVDLIYGLPGQTLDNWKNELDKFIRLNAEHVSFYDLKIEKGTPFYARRKSLQLPDNDVQAQMYKLGCEKLKTAGFIHYEISSFSRKGKQSIHNQIYWRNREYIGLGAGAYSYLNGRRFSKHSNLSKYQQQAKSGRFRHYHQEQLKDNDRLRETIILNLRLLRGFSVRSIEKSQGLTLDMQTLKKLEEFHKAGFLAKSRDRYRLSKKGILLYDTLACEILA